MSTIIPISLIDCAKARLALLTRVERLAYGTELVQAFIPGAQTPKSEVAGRNAVKKILELTSKLEIDIKDLKDKEKQPLVAEVIAEAMLIKAQNQRTKIVEKTLDYGISKNLFNS